MTSFGPAMAQMHIGTYQQTFEPFKKPRSKDIVKIANPYQTILNTSKQTYGKINWNMALIQAKHGTITVLIIWYYLVIEPFQTFKTNDEV